MDEIVPAFETTLFDPTLSDACMDLAELGIDSLVSQVADGVGQGIPIVSLLVGVKSSARNIYDRNLLKQMVKFINEFNTKKIPAKKLEKHRQKLEKNPKNAEEELGRVVLLLNSNIDLKKSELLAKFYRAYINEDIDWDTFCELSDITSRLFLSDLSLLQEIYQGRIKDTTQCQTYRAERLIALGVLRTAPKTITVGSGGGGGTERYVGMNEIGETFCNISFA